MDFLCSKNEGKNGGKNGPIKYLAFLPPFFPLYLLCNTNNYQIDSVRFFNSLFV